MADERGPVREAIHHEVVGAVSEWLGLAITSLQAIKDQVDAALASSPPSAPPPGPEGSR